MVVVFIGKYNRDERAPSLEVFWPSPGASRIWSWSYSTPWRCCDDWSSCILVVRKPYGAPARGGFGGGERRSFWGRCQVVPAIMAEWSWWTSSFGGRGSSFSGRGGFGGGRRNKLPPQPSYKQYMFTPKDESGELKFLPTKSQRNFMTLSSMSISSKNW